jgi:hypothetical protein
LAIMHTTPSHSTLHDFLRFLTNSFLGVGKLMTLKVMRDSEALLSGLKRLGKEYPLHPSTYDAVESFVVKLYDAKAPPDMSINSLRYHLFCKRGGKSHTLPPTQDSLALHARRTNFQLMIWLHALDAHFPLPDPCDNGWCLHNEILSVVGMALPSIPSTVLVDIKCHCKASCGGRCSHSRQKLPCTDLCGCGIDYDKKVIREDEYAEDSDDSS